MAFFETRSFLQRCCDNWCYMDLLVEAGRTDDPVERMRYVVAFVVAGLSKQIGANKPFNPILGETFQAKYGKQRVQVCMEQISHHPPISSWEVRDEAGTFTFIGNANWAASTRGNSVKGWQTGTNQITFHTDHARISWELPSLLIKGIMWGERVLKYQGELTFRDDTNGVVCKVEASGTEGKGAGNILRDGGLVGLMLWFSFVPQNACVNGLSVARPSLTPSPPVLPCPPPPFPTPQIDPKPQGSLMRLFGGSNKKREEWYPDIVRGSLQVDGVEVDRCEGTWLTALVWQNGGGRGVAKKYWDSKSAKWFRPDPVSSPLQSDCRFRQDLHYLIAVRRTGGGEAIYITKQKKSHCSMSPKTSTHRSSKNCCALPLRSSPAG